MQINQALETHKDAQLLFTQEEVDEAIASLAKRLTAEFENSFLVLAAPGCQLGLDDPGRPHHSSHYRSLARSHYYAGRGRDSPEYGSNL